MEDKRPSLDNNQGFDNDTKSKYNTTDKTLRQKLEILNELLVDECINNLSSGKIRPNDLGAIVTLLKNNKVVELTPPHDEAELIEDLIKRK